MMKTPSAAARHGLRRPLERLFSQTLSFADQEVLLLVENSGASMARSLRRAEPFTTAGFATSFGVAAPDTMA